MTEKQEDLLIYGNHITDSEGNRLSPDIGTKYKKNDKLYYSDGMESKNKLTLSPSVIKFCETMGDLLRINLHD